MLPSSAITVAGLLASVAVALGATAGPSSTAGHPSGSGPAASARAVAAT